jgi:hypothetical protein
MINVEFYTRENYGMPTRYPANDAGKLACALAGTRTITPSMEHAILAHGGTMVEVFRPRA